MVNVARNLVLRSSKFLATFSIVLFRALTKLINSSCVADVARDGRLANSERAMLRCSVGSSDNVGEFCGSRAGVLAGDELIVQSVSDVAEGVDGVRVQSVGGEMVFSVVFTEFWKNDPALPRHGLTKTDSKRRPLPKMQMRRCALWKCG